MRSSSVIAFAIASSVALSARAQTGFALERLYPSAPGAGWFVMDDLDMHGGFGGAISLTGGYAHDPLPGIVTDEGFMNIGLAGTYDRFRAYLDFSSPVAVKGVPNVDFGTHPDLISDVRFGFDMRVFGEPRSAFRLGIGAQIFVPNGTREDYVSDETFRAMFRALFAGDAGAFTWAAQVGAHLRIFDQGPELLFGAAAGARLPLGKRNAFVIGPELFGETALRHSATGLEWLLSARIEGTADDVPQVRVKIGGGGGLDPNFGAPEWRLVLGIELFGVTHKR